MDCGGSLSIFNRVLQFVAGFLLDFDGFEKILVDCLWILLVLWRILMDSKRSWWIFADFGGSRGMLNGFAWILSGF